MKIIDQNGRIGTVTERREGGCFAKPEGTKHTIGGNGARFITATHWSERPDGSLHGLWYDAKLNDFVSAKYLDEV